MTCLSVQTLLRFRIHRSFRQLWYSIYWYMFGLSFWLCKLFTPFPSAFD